MTTRRLPIRVELALLGLLTLVLYAALWSTQRALWLNGLDPASNEVVRSGADVPAGLTQTAVIVVLGLLVVACFVRLVQRAPVYRAAGLQGAALAIPGVVGLGLLLLPPTLSNDLYSYLSHGYLAATPGSNPYTDDSASVATYAYGRLLLQEGWQAVHPPTPYGPVWTALERAAYTISGDDVGLGVLLLKIPALLSVVAIGVLTFRLLRRRGPDTALRGCLLFVANPLVLIELLGDGHNDGLMAALLVVAIVATVHRRAFFAIVALALAVLIKTSVLPFIVPFAVYLFVRRRSTRRLLGHAVLGVVTAGAIAVLSIAPYWRGLDTFSGLRTGGTLQGWSVAGVLRKVALAGASATGASTASSLQIVQAVLVALLVVGTLLLSRRATTERGLLGACGAISLLILLLLPFNWPWYATMPAAVLPLVPELASAVAVVLLVVGARVAAPFSDAVTVGALGNVFLYGVQTFVSQTVPSAVGLLLTGSTRAARRLTRARDRSVDEARSGS